jgi:ubiquitin carboxyl-terminal hydrolase 7
VHVFHFARDPSRTHAVPFRVLIRPGETVADVKKRIQTRLGVNEKEFQKIKFGLVTHGSRVNPLEDDDEVIGDRTWEAYDSIGLDHVDKSAKRFGGFEKAIKIHN